MWRNNQTHGWKEWDGTCTHTYTGAGSSKKIDKIVRPLVNLTKGKYRDDPDEKNSRWNGRDYKKQWGHLECHHVVL